MLPWSAHPLAKTAASIELVYESPRRFRDSGFARHRTIRPPSSRAVTANRPKFPAMVDGGPKSQSPGYRTPSRPQQCGVLEFSKRDLEWGKKSRVSHPTGRSRQGNSIGTPTGSLLLKPPVRRSLFIAQPRTHAHQQQPSNPHQRCRASLPRHLRTPSHGRAWGGRVGPGGVRRCRWYSVDQLRSYTINAGRRAPRDTTKAGLSLPKK